ncbi:MAG: tyrosine--tRNA ligase [Rubrivivax sp.]|jgi:tyrosyl-tRNA synthetase|nr:tyrosine--tRNA ligase [Rubrivivax sp.]
MTHILDELSWRDSLHQHTDLAELRAHLAQPRTLYCGFDPTAASLHVGSLVPVMALRRFQRAGHHVLALVGGATGMVGDPSGRSDERNLLDEATLAENVAGIRATLERFLDFDGANPARIVNNLDWTRDVSVLGFLRDVGKHMTVNSMLAKDSVKGRIERPDAGISYTEFSYMLLQAFDFAEQHRLYGCTLQIGGSDQWGNITAGIELGRKMRGAALHGATVPLLLTSDGRKMGKTARGAIWLDAARTSPYAFYQYWLNVADADVLVCLKLLTELPQDEVLALAEAIVSDPARRAAQRRLAGWLTAFVHGEAGLAAAERASAVLFGAEIGAGTLDDAALLDIFADVPSVAVERATLDAGWPLLDALVQTGLASSKSDGRRALQAGAVAVNNRRVDADRPLTAADLASASVLVLRNGKKRYALARVA